MTHRVREGPVGLGRGEHALGGRLGGQVRLAMIRQTVIRRTGSRQIDY